MLKSRARQSRVLFVVSVITSMACAALVWAQTPVDPQSLVGEWSGQWASRGGSSQHMSGPLSMTVTRVEGTAVSASFSSRGGTRGFQIWDSKGNLEGNILRFGNSTYTIDGTTMTGSNTTSNLTLSKTK